MLPPGIDLATLDLTRLSPNERVELLELLELREALIRESRRLQLFPDEGIYRRELYAKHMELIEAGKKYRERCFMAANRVGKTLTGAYETSFHLTGDYPDWWPGVIFRTPTRCWAAGKTNETTRDIVQKEMLGEIAFEGARKIVDGTGMVPRDALGAPTWKQGVPDLVDTIKVKHKPSGLWSRLGFKSYQQGRGSFEGTAQHFIWLDEEPPRDIYEECLVRTGTTGGRILLTFTPLEGLSEVVLQFLPKEYRPGEA